MYIEFYGLKELPFALTPDPRYLYFTPSHTEVMANLHYGIESGRGLIVVTGEVGTGKTTLLRWMMQRLDRTVMVAYIFNPRLTVAEFYQYLATLFNIGEWENKTDLLIELGKMLETRHSHGLRTVLVVDEGHGLSTDVLEEIRLLCNFESDTAKHLQIVLTGQPELREVLNQPNLRQLKQRVALSFGRRATAMATRTEIVRTMAPIVRLSIDAKAPTASRSSRPRLSRTSSLTNTHDGLTQSALKSSARRTTVPASGEETMGRVYDALKRAEGQPRTSISKTSVSHDGNVYEFAYPAKRAEAEHPWDVSPFIASPVVISSASTAHTEEATGGPALPGGPASRDAGATLGAVGSARATEFSSRAISAARVE